MAFRYDPMGEKVARDPAGAAAELAEQLRAAKGYATDAAKALGVDYTTFQRWLRRLAEAGHDVRELAKLPARKGRPRDDAPPVKPTRAAARRGKANGRPRRARRAA